ncbi:hypothetical protein AB1Y20_022234 [Prymnesium parvum]|uniref:Exostosin GT47 domain-containing protein n=1 Tax=Prymnesium parvum TaxID=97485 RepID=A0AB34JHC9_PRYPA
MAERRCDASRPRPRVFTYHLPAHIAPPASAWRLARPLVEWVRASRFHEADGACADFFLVPSHPSKSDDAAVARLFGYIRAAWPWWNLTAGRGLARHLLLLPCDHGPGDCAFSRPIAPNKWAHLSPRRRRRAAEDPLAAWGGAAWELLNPASPARAVVFLQYNGKADQLAHREGRCVVCFQPGLDVRLPTPETHMCGPLCGMHAVADERGRTPLPVALQRELLGRHVRPAVGLGEARRKGRLAAAGGRAAGGGRSECLLWWSGADRGNNLERRTLVQQAALQPDLCVTNTLARPANGTSTKCDGTALSRCAGASKWELALDMSRALSSADFCYSPLGWDNGDSDRYLPAVLHGCIPVMSDPLEAMPLEELPDLHWPDFTLAASRLALPRLSQLLRAVPRARVHRMRAHLLRAWPRLLYTTVHFSSLPTRGTDCAGCSPYWPQCSTDRQPAAARALEDYCAPPAPAPCVPNARLTCAAVCSRNSYFGEDGSRDALEGLMEVLRRRLDAPRASLEPWATATGRSPPDATWFHKRAEYYAELLHVAWSNATNPLQMQSAHPPCPLYRETVAEMAHTEGMQHSDAAHV